MKVYRQKFKIFLILLLTCVILLVISTQLHQKKGIFQFKHSPIEKSSSTPIFLNFYPATTTDATPDCYIKIQLNDYIYVNDSECFYYTPDNWDHKYYISTHKDNFDNQDLAEFWSRLNQANGIFIENDSVLEIKDLMNSEWGRLPGQAPVYTAPAITQKVQGDFELSVKINATSFNTTDHHGGILLYSTRETLLFNIRLSPADLSEKIEILSIEDSSITLMKSTTVAPYRELTLIIKRTNNNFIFSYVLPGNESQILHETQFLIDSNVNVGLYAAGNASLKFDDFYITPAINASLTTDKQFLELFATGVPFKQFDTDNYIIFSFTGNTTDFNSTENRVNIDCSSGPVEFTSFYPESTHDTTPDIKVYMKSTTIGFNGSEIQDDTCAFAYTKDGSQPTQFINPHIDKFEYFNKGPGQALPKYWKRINEDNLNYTYDVNDRILSIRDKSNSSWTSTTKNAPAILQYLFGDFITIAKLQLYPSRNWSGGMLLIISDSLSYHLSIKSRDNQVEIITRRITQVEDVILGETTIATDLAKNGLWLRISYSNDLFTFSYSLTGDSYNIYFDVASEEVITTNEFEVGLFAYQNSSINVHYWDITPSVEVTFESPNYFTISVANVPFKQYNDNLNCLRVSIINIDNITSYSNVYYPEIRPASSNKTYILCSNGDRVCLMDTSGGLNWSYYMPNSLDKELTQNGNILITTGEPGHGQVVEIDMNKNVLWSITEVGGIPLNFPHDADRLPNGNTLIADTGNDRAIEVTLDGNIAWSWYAWDYFSAEDAIKGQSYLNDVDRLPNGNTLICLRDLSTVIEVDPDGKIVWLYGGPGSGLLNKPHNPDRLLNGNTLICDSENRRIVEVTPAGAIKWQYNPESEPGVPMLGWPRDADLLPDGHLLISDTRVNGRGKNAIYEIDRESGEIIWIIETEGANYDTDLVVLDEPRVEILELDNTTYVSKTVGFMLKCVSNFDDAYYNIKDLTTNEWLYRQPVKYNGRVEVTLENLHSYTLMAWANSTGNLGGGYPQDDSIIRYSGSATNTTFSINTHANFTDNKPFPGTTILVSNYPPILYEVDNQNRILWKHKVPVPEKDRVVASGLLGVDLLPNNHLLYCLNVYYKNDTIVSWVREIDYNGTIFWEYKDMIPHMVLHGWIHDADYLPNTDTFLIADTSWDRVIEVDRNCSILWKWEAKDHYAIPEEMEQMGYHLNDVDRLPNGNTLISLRNLNLVLEVNKTGDVV
ncbi:MAG: aryl-sulfate sulfotransferase, partial [Promethearchaeota archaeon]